ncbi:MAG: diaminopimelate epimerase [candidate division NC10 bacterium]|nr:diaminopimelate epimerase [candidate division NC10 bacterium]
MKKIPFYKMSGSGNDFLVIDNRKGVMPKGASRFVPQVCRRRVSAGADGVLLVEPSRKANFRMLYYNADGSEAEMCGNGARCIARFAFLQGIAPARMVFETKAGLVRAEVKGERVKVQMGDPHSLSLNMKILVQGSRFTVHSINTGVPHAVLFYEDLEKVPVKELGPKIRFHQAFQPAGTNVDFIRIKGPGDIEIRTYERGVEDETLACGTGCVAAAIVAAALGEVRSPVALQTRGGETLSVYFDKKGKGFTSVFLEGGARVVYEGELWEEAWKY